MSWDLMARFIPLGASRAGKMGDTVTIRMVVRIRIRQAEATQIALLKGEGVEITRSKPPWTVPSLGTTSRRVPMILTEEGLMLKAVDMFRVVLVAIEIIKSKVRIHDGCRVSIRMP